MFKEKKISQETKAYLLRLVLDLDDHQFKLAILGDILLLFF